MIIKPVSFNTTSSPALFKLGKLLTPKLPGNEATDEVAHKILYSPGKIQPEVIVPSADASPIFQPVRSKILVLTL